MTKSFFEVMAVPFYIKKPDLGKECDDCHVPLDPSNRRCSLCDRHYPLHWDFEKDRCEHCGSYEVHCNMDERWWCDDCHQWIESTNEGNGDNYGDCYECGNGYKKEDPEQKICYWCK